MKTNIKTYSELNKLNTFEERFKYLELRGSVGEDTFGFDRIVNQQFYKSREWKRVRAQVIDRDSSRDLGVEDHDIYGTVYVHHMNPINVYDIENASEQLLNPEYLICVSLDTHNAIHYGTKDYLESKKIIDRKIGDTTLWERT